MSIDFPSSMEEFIPSFGTHHFSLSMAIWTESDGPVIGATCFVARIGEEVLQDHYLLEELDPSLSASGNHLKCAIALARKYGYDEKAYSHIVSAQLTDTTHVHIPTGYVSAAQLPNNEMVGDTSNAS